MQSTPRSASSQANQAFRLIPFFSSTKSTLNTIYTPLVSMLKMKRVSRRMPKKSKCGRRRRRRIVRFFFPPLRPRTTLKGAHKIASTPNFISEIFYLTAAIYHLHFRPVELYLKRIAADSRNFRERIEAVENDPSWRGVSPRPIPI